VTGKLLAASPNVCDVSPKGMRRHSQSFRKTGQTGLLRLLILSVIPAASGEDFRFLEPAPTTYAVESAIGKHAAGDKWLKVARADGSGDGLEFGDRIILKCRPGLDPAAIAKDHGLRITRRLADDTVIAQTTDARTAARLADRLSRLPGMRIACPVRRQALNLDSAYAPLPNDRYFPRQIHLENRDATGEPAGADINARSAWTVTAGEGATVAIADTGVELDHPDLRDRMADGLHHNFANDTADGNPRLIPSALEAHGTAVAGIVAAERGNQLGGVGIAPAARLASWVISGDSGQTLVDDEALMDLFQFHNDVVSVQNHSWGHAGKTQQPLTPLEEIGVEKAYSEGRHGLGVVMVRSAGNSRMNGENMNDDAYPSDPRVIAVAATEADGRAAASSEPGAAILVAAPVRTADRLGIFTTDLVGTNGADQITRLPPDEGREDYQLFAGTSAAAPQISGIVAMMLSTNPGLHVRDAQQILIHSARHFDLDDPDLRANGAGFLVSHNVGYGIPDAGTAVRLAGLWSNRPPRESLSLRQADAFQIPDAGLGLRVSGVNLPADLRSIRALPSTGVHPDRPTRSLELVHVGEGLDGSLPDLSDKAALIRRDANDRWNEQLAAAAAAGAELAVVYNNAAGSRKCPGGDALCVMLGTDFAPLPAVFIGQSAGEALAARIATNAPPQAWLSLDSARRNFHVTDALVCEHISLRVRSDHPIRGDLRITLKSPRGTTSVLQKLNDDLTPGPTDWTYHSAQHFYESSLGTWTVAITDEFANNIGSIAELELIVRGVRITDSDADGLDDDWERARLGGLTFGPTGDPDGDGYSNAREQILGFDPRVADIDFRVDLSLWKTGRARLSWPGVKGRQYEVLTGSSINDVATRMAIVDGRFPETEHFVDSAALGQGFFMVREAPRH